jgi:hypothetical protein
MRFELIIVAHAIVTLTQIAVLHLFFTRFLGKKAKSAYAYITVYACYFILKLLSHIIYVNLWVTGVTTALSFLFIALTLYSGNLLKNITTAGIAVAYYFISEPLTASIIMWFSGHIYPEFPANDMFFFIGLALSSFIHLAILCVLSYKRTPRKSTIQQKYQLLLLALISICCFIAYSDISYIVRTGLPMSTLKLFTILATGAISVLMFYVFEQFQESAEKELIAAMLKSQMIEMRHQLEIIELHDIEMRMLKHDLNNQLMVLKHISETEHSRELQNLAANLTEHIESSTRLSITGVPVIDAIISIKKAQAETQDTEFIVKAVGVKKIVINAIHLNIVIGNALDNALEACSRLPEDFKRYIEFALKTEGNFLYIRITNSSLPVKRYLNDLPASTKRSGLQNGYGLESIRRIVTAYNGIFRINTSEDEFIISLRIRNYNLRSPLNTVNDELIVS